jgi:hypothetical protein
VGNANALKIIKRTATVRGFNVIITGDDQGDGFMRNAVVTEVKLGNSNDESSAGSVLTFKNIHNFLMLIGFALPLLHSVIAEVCG